MVSSLLGKLGVDVDQELAERVRSQSLEQAKWMSGLGKEEEKERKEKKDEEESGVGVGGRGGGTVYRLRASDIVKDEPIVPSASSASAPPSSSSSSSSEETRKGATRPSSPPSPSRSRSRSSPSPLEKLAENLPDGRIPEEALLSYDDLASVAEAVTWMACRYLDLVEFLDRTLPWRRQRPEAHYASDRRQLVGFAAEKLVQAYRDGWGEAGRLKGKEEISVEGLKRVLAERQRAREEGKKKEKKSGKSGAKKEEEEVTTAAAAGAAAAEKEEKSESAAKEPSLGDLLSDPARAVRETTALLTEEEVVDNLATSVSTILKLQGAVDSILSKVTGGGGGPGGGGGAAEAVDEAISTLRALRRRSGGEGDGSPEDTLLRSPELLAARVLRRIKERKGEEAREKLLKRRRRTSRSSSRNSSEGGGGSGDGDDDGGLRRSGLVRRWPMVDGPLRYWKVPLLVGIEGAGLAALTLATHSALAAAVAQGVGLFALALVEKKGKEKATTTTARGA